MLIAQSPFQGIIEVSKPLLQKGKVIKMANKTNDLAHTKWMCKYHIVFTPKYRRKIIYNQYQPRGADGDAPHLRVPVKSFFNEGGKYSAQKR